MFSMKMPSISGKVALITGASKGLGKEFCRVLLDKGAKVSAVCSLFRIGVIRGIDQSDQLIRYSIYNSDSESGTEPR